jgi:RluA family pseudouridine synthase
LIPILFEDDYLLIAEKPAALPVHVTVDPNRPHLQGLLEQQLGGKKLVLFHRLDVDTTGVIILGKDPSINGAMTDLFHDRKIEKTYWALVDGRWSPHDKRHESYIKKVFGGRWKSFPKGKSSERALTLFNRIEDLGSHTWIEAKPHTGRTHQIRLHCLDLGHPILGDRLYGRAHPRGVPLALHARSLRFIHPVSKKEILVEAPKPEHWKHYEKSL